MTFLRAVVQWLTQSAHWHGATGIPYLFVHQLELSGAVVAAAFCIGGGAGMALGHYGRGGLVAVNAANAARAVPTLALLTIFAIVPSISLSWGGFLASFLALVVLAIPPILTNTYVGVRGVDAEVRDAAAGMGMTGPQTLARVEAPLALPLVMAGVRTASIEVVATSTLAAYVSYSDLGTYVIAGLDTNDTVEAFCGALLVAVTAGVVALVLAQVERALMPRPFQRQRRRLVAAVGVGAPTGVGASTRVGA